MRFLSRQSGGLSGELSVPGDKSISHRALMFGGLANGITRVRNLLQGEDVLATAAAMQQLGVVIDQSDDEWRIHGRGAAALQAPVQPLDLGNSGTGMRLLCGLLAGQGIGATLTGDDSLRSRPMARILRPLQQMGAVIESDEGRAPLRIQGGVTLSPVDYAMSLASAQVKSCVLLAALGASGTTRVTEPAASRDHTETLLAAYGVALCREGLSVSLRGPQSLQGPVQIEVPGDFSSAAFFLVAGSILPGSDITLRAVGMNPLRSGLLEVLIAMGGNIEVRNLRRVAGEPIADLRVQSANLAGVAVPVEVVPRMIDEFPALFLAAAVARGQTRITGAEELRVKESDRIAVMARALNALGARIDEHPDGATITGVGQLSGGRVDGAMDHRCAMTLAIAGLSASAPVTVDGADNVATSYPGYIDHVQRLGGDVAVMDD